MTFVLLCLAVLASVVATEFYEVADTCLVLVAINTLLALACWALYAWYWIRNKKVSTVYAWVTWLFLALAYSSGLAWYARHLRVTAGMDCVKAFVDSDIWSYRFVPVMVALIWMLAMIVGRLTEHHDGEGQ